MSDPIKDFAAKVKEKYPEYAEVDDYALTRRIAEKYPDYHLDRSRHPVQYIRYSLRGSAPKQLKAFGVRQTFPGYCRCVLPLHLVGEIPQMENTGLEGDTRIC